MFTHTLRVQQLQDARIHGDLNGIQSQLASGSAAVAKGLVVNVSCIRITLLLSNNDFWFDKALAGMKGFFEIECDLQTSTLYLRERLEELLTSQGLLDKDSFRFTPESFANLCQQDNTKVETFNMTVPMEKQILMLITNNLGSPVDGIRLPPENYDVTVLVEFALLRVTMNTTKPHPKNLAFYPTLVAAVNRFKKDLSSGAVRGLPQVVVIIRLLPTFRPRMPSTDSPTSTGIPVNPITALCCEFFGSVFFQISLTS